MPLQAPPSSLIVSGVHGPTVVGDGSLAGRRCSLIRLGGCNLSCTWCDSPQTWDGSRFNLAAELTERLVKNVVAEALECAPRLVLITGGEPLRQQRREGWAALLDALTEAGVEIVVETNGTIAPREHTLQAVHHFHVSPKLAHSGDPAWARLPEDLLRGWAQMAAWGRADLTFVVRDAPDLATVSALVQLHGLPIEQVWISAEGVTSGAVVESARRIAETALAWGYNVSPRLHVVLWGDALRPDPELVGFR